MSRCRPAWAEAKAGLEQGQGMAGPELRQVERKAGPQPKLRRPCRAKAYATGHR
jgi:hypothetical protein